MKVQSPIAGAMSGSAGKMIFQHYHGNTYGRAFPFIFHYQPTAPQFAAQTKYYGIRRKWLPIYRQIRNFIPDNQQKQTNAYNVLTKAIYLNLGTFEAEQQPVTVRKFGFDVYDRLQLSLGNYTLYYDGSYYYITFWDFIFAKIVNFSPMYAHALYMCPDLQELQYNMVDFNAEHLTFIFDNSHNWFPDHSFEMYVALSDDQFFSNFYY